MSNVTIPFNAWSRVRIGDGRKHATGRTKQLGEPGDTFTVNNKAFMILAVVELPTDFIINHLYMIEGAVNPAELHNILKKIFARTGKIPEKLFVHFFTHIIRKTK